MDILGKVSAKSNPNRAAGASAEIIREQDKVDLQAIGAGASNLTIKAVAIAKGYVVPSGVDLIFILTFIDIEIDGEKETAIRLIIEPK